MTKTRPPFALQLALSDIQYRNCDDDEALRIIADAIRNGISDPYAIKTLSDIIDPDTDTPVSLVIKRPKGAPKKRKNSDLEAFLQNFIWNNRKNFDAEITEAMQRFSVSRTTVTETLKRLTNENHTIHMKYKNSPDN